MYEPASLGMFQCRLQRILCDFEVIMFFRKDPPQTEGRRDADPLIKFWSGAWHGVGAQVRGLNIAAHQAAPGASGHTVAWFTIFFRSHG